MLKDKKVIFKPLLIYIMFLLIISISCNIYSISQLKKTADEVMQLTKEKHEYFKEIEKLRLEIESINKNIESENETSLREVLFTSYYLNDGSSGSLTASGLSIDDFKINEYGYYTYQGKVVVATANTSRLDLNLKQGYKSHELYDEFQIVLNGIELPAIVLDVCGACYGFAGEDLQRYDIFTNGVSLGVIHGYVKEVKK